MAGSPEELNAADTTDLLIGPIGIPDTAARGVIERMTTLGGDVRRTVNGELIDLTPAQFKKFRCEWSCTDLDSPALSAIYPGAELTVVPITELVYLTASGSPDRAVYSSRTKGAFTLYRPILDVRIIEPWEIELDEAGGRLGWTVIAEEI